MWGLSLGRAKQLHLYTFSIALPRSLVVLKIVKAESKQWLL